MKPLVYRVEALVDPVRHRIPNVLLEPAPTPVLKAEAQPLQIAPSQTVTPALSERGT